MKTIILLAASLLFFNSSFSQKQATAAKSIYGEIQAVSGIAVFTGNFDSRIGRKENGFGYHFGAGLIGASGLTVFVIPLGLNYLAGNKAPHYFEIGAGATILTVSSSGFGGATGVAFVPTAGYRYQPLEKGFTFRLFVSPWIAGGGAIFGGGLSVGIKL